MISFSGFKDTQSEIKAWILIQTDGHPGEEFARSEAVGE